MIYTGKWETVGDPKDLTERVTLGVVTRSKGIVQPTDVMFPPELA